MKKGPGRRPQSAKRDRFMELRARGWSVAAAGREAGVSRTTGGNWSRGYKVYRRGAVVGFVEPLDQLAVRQISGRYLSLDERILIADLRQRGISIRQIAREICRHPSTVSRELRRAFGTEPSVYRPFEAHRHAVRSRARPRPRRADSNPQLRTLIADLLNQRWSPQQIARHLRVAFPDEPRMWLCHESIYQAVYQPGSALSRPSRLAPHRRSPLRTGRDHRRAQQHLERRRPRFEQPMRSIHDRPFPPEDRSEEGNWEGDLIVGAHQASAIGTLVERQTRLVRLLHLPSRDSDTLHAALATRLADLPPSLLRSITWDQGSEMARHLTITASIGAKIYFCDSRSPWQRGSNENTNGLLRDYFPKGSDLSIHTPEHLQAVEDELNRRPRIVLENRSPAELFAVLLASHAPPVLRR
jgi:IS30 family transposase